MTERTVTIQTEEEQTVTLCDECGLSDDAGQIVTYKVSQAESKGVENVRDYDALHLHRACLNDMGVDVPDMTTYEEFVDENVIYMDAPLLAIDGFSAASLVVAALGVFYIGLLWGHPVSFLGVFPIGLGLVFGVWMGRDAATDAVDELQ